MNPVSIVDVVRDMHSTCILYAQDADEDDLDIRADGGEEVDRQNTYGRKDDEGNEEVQPGHGEVEVVQDEEEQDPDDVIFQRNRTIIMRDCGFESSEGDDSSREDTEEAAPKKRRATFDCMLCKCNKECRQEFRRDVECYVCDDETCNFKTPVEGAVLNGFGSHNAAEEEAQKKM